MQPVILVSGKNGQLGSELQSLASQFPGFMFAFHDRNTMDVTDESSLAACFEQSRPAFFINTAAYTAVDKAETDQASAYLVNATATGLIAALCKKYGTKLIHISTDYVFDGTATTPYLESDATNPVNYYGYTKLVGELMALSNNPATVVVRTSWVYSTYGHNFVKTMLRLMKERTEIAVVADQVGSPTNAADLAAAIMHIISITAIDKAAFVPGIFHFSNDGMISWYDFAVAIRDIKAFSCIVQPIPATRYPTPAKRPAFSVMSKEKITSVYGIQLRDWRQSLAHCLQLL